MSIQLLKIPQALAESSLEGSQLSVRAHGAPIVALE
jgi:hypothetical protein